MVAYESLKLKEKFNWVIPKVVVVAYRCSCLQELFIMKFNLEFKWGFTKVAVTRADHLQEKCSSFLFKLFGLVLSLVSAISVIFVFVTERTITERFYSWFINS